MTDEHRQLGDSRPRHYYETLRWVMKVCGAANKTPCYMLYVALADYAFLAGGPFVGIKTLSEKTGMSQRVLDRAIKDAKILGLIRTHPGRGRAGTSYWELAKIEPFSDAERGINVQLSPSRVLGGKPANLTEVRVDSPPNGSTSCLSEFPENELSEILKSGCDCITHAIKHGDFTERLGTPPDIQGLETKAAQRKVINEYLGTPPKCYSQSERRAWYDYEAQWNYPHGADTKVKARHDVAWAWGVPVEDVDTIDGWWWLLEQAQKAHSGLDSDGRGDFIDPQSQTLVKWHTARMWVDRKDSREWGFWDYDSYTEDIGFRDADWPPVRQPGSAA